MLLARTWFHRSAKWVLENHSSDEIAEMQAAYVVDPWGERADDVRRATAGIATARGMSECVSFDDFMPPFDAGQEAVELQPAEMRRRLRAALAGRFVDARAK